MMKIVKILLFIIVAVLAIFTAVYAYYGGFTKIAFEQAELGGETIVWEEMIGNYKNSPVVMDKVYNSLLTDFNISTTRGFGIYYDNPQVVDPDNCRSDLGCIVDNIDSTTLSAIEAKFKVNKLELQKCVVAVFPYKGQMSVVVGLTKVYPALNKYLQENNIANGQVMEIYDIPNKTITYRMMIGE